MARGGRRKRPGLEATGVAGGGEELHGGAEIRSGAKVRKWSVAATSHRQERWPLGSLTRNCAVDPGFQERPPTLKKPQLRTAGS